MKGEGPFYYQADQEKYSQASFVRDIFPGVVLFIYNYKSRNAFQSPNDAIETFTVS